jgi:hypothetical protein
MAGVGAEDTSVGGRVASPFCFLGILGFAIIGYSLQTPKFKKV